MTNHDNKPKDFAAKVLPGEDKEEQKKGEVQTERGVKESDFNKEGKSNLNKVGIRSASDLNAIDTLNTTFADVAQGQELKINLAEEYENIKALKIKFADKRGPFKFKVNDSDQEFESKKSSKGEAEIFQLDEPIDGSEVCICPTGDNGAEIVSVEVFVEGDPNKRKGHDDRNPPAPKAKENGAKKGERK